MGSPVTFSGFNGIDWSVVLDSVMKQASEPLAALQDRQSNVKAQVTAMTKLTTQVTALQTAANDLKKSTAGDTVTASSTDSSSVSVTTGSGAVAGRYDIVVQSLARAQVTASATTVADADTTTAATGGSLTIGGTTVTLSGAVTLQGLASAINATADIGVTASVVQSGSSAYRLVLTGKETGADESFSISNDLTGTPLSFGANAVEASDASILVNNVQAVSATNTFSSAVPGVTLTVLKADPDETIGVNVTASSSALKTRLDAFVKAYNDIAAFVADQKKQQAAGNDGNLSRDPMLRSLTVELRTSLSQSYGGGAVTRLSELGLEFTTTGTLKLDATKFEKAMTDSRDDATALLTGASGAFGSIWSMLDGYTNSDGLLKADKDRLDSQSRSLDTQLQQAQDRLAVYRQTMQQEFLAAEMAMSRLKAQSGTLASVGGQS